MNKALLAKKFIFKLLGFHTEEEVIQNLYLKGLLDSFERIKSKDLTEYEEKIRDAFIKDLETLNPITKDLVQD